MKRCTAQEAAAEALDAITMARALRGSAEEALARRFARFARERIGVYEEILNLWVISLEEASDNRCEAAATLLMKTMAEARKAAIL